MERAPGMGAGVADTGHEIPMADQEDRPAIRLGIVEAFVQIGYGPDRHEVVERLTEGVVVDHRAEAERHFAAEEAPGHHQPESDEREDPSGERIDRAGKPDDAAREEQNRDARHHEGVQGADALLETLRVLEVGQPRENGDDGGGQPKP